MVMNHGFKEIDRNVKTFCVWVGFMPNIVPPTTNRLNSKFCSVRIDSYRDESLIFCNVINSIWNRLTKFLVDEIVDFYICRFSLWQPCFTAIFIIPYQLLLLCIDRNDRISALLECDNSFINMKELLISIRMEEPSSVFLFPCKLYFCFRSS
jgi:hypothetical protein